MTVQTDVAAPHALSDAEALRVAVEVAGRVRVGSAERDRESRHPRAELDDLATTGLLGIAVPTEYGGGGVRPSTVAEVFRLLAVGDPAVSQLLLSHFVLIELLKEAGSAEQKEFFFGEAVRGVRFGNATAERGTKHVFDRRTSLTADGDGYALNGRKFYTTGALASGWIGVAASVDGDQAQPVIAFVRPDDEGVAFADDWTAFGQRPTASGSIEFTDVRVPAERVLVLGPVPADPPPQTLGAYDQILHAAIDVGIGRAALEDGAAFVAERSRPWFESGHDRAADEPHTLLHFGKLTTRLHALEALFARAGAVLDAAYAAPALTDANTAAASLAVAEAKAFAQEISLQIASDILELSGTSAADSTHALDRHWRNARVHTLHDPARWKYHHIGNHTLNTTNPPRYPLL
ncbi:SfnB family sulfur acquisition oxidoreductase [Actinocorallia sp. A-T 12471]|uniref:SfnB family sulfur acquisition oxidoreductase n=1 Tax=Actinocorallia sp. A-T 12471 TaxID=3089813 RepID=UPI0029CC8A7E|nr:SfnB family sulfur acquisition oxidoreductase [Actinocorallia sp. A-T 12471]MDX6742514.1 SfnB family sulfur acquisition oxidoreductase [Actinocorallia sp. A-T 12471]